MWGSGLHEMRSLSVWCRWWLDDGGCRGGVHHRGDCSTFKANPDSGCDSTYYKRFRGKVSSVFPRDKRLMIHIFCLASELGSDVISGAEMKAQDGKAGYLRAHSPVTTNILTYYYSDHSFLRVFQRERKYRERSTSATYIEYEWTCPSTTYKAVFSSYVACHSSKSAPLNIPSSSKMKKLEGKASMYFQYFVKY